MREIDGEKATTLGALGYSLEKCAVILDTTEGELQKNTQFKKMYKKGAAMRDYAIDSAVFQLARKGDMNAIKLLQEKTQKAYIEPDFD